jgi:cytochrome P450
MEACRRRYGETFTMRLAGLPPFVVFTNPADIKEIFTGNPEIFHAGSANSVLKPILGRSSLLLLDGERHMKERRLMMPSFHGERMHAYARIMEEAADRAIDRWPVGAPFSLHTEMQEITLDVIVRTVFGMSEGAAKDELRRSLVNMLSFGERPALLLLVGADGELRWRDWHERLGRFSPWASFRRTIDEVDGRLLSEIRARRTSGGEGDDVLSMLLGARGDDGELMSDEQLVAEMKTLLVAGHETTATALTWTVLELQRHPAVLERLAREIESGDETYLDAVVKESLRLRPIVPMVGRRLQAAASIAGRSYPAGTVLTPNIYLTHRNPRVWKDPERFAPERFLDWKPNPYEFLPFGGGVRRCIGLAFALFEMKRVLARMVKRTRLRLAPGYRPRLVRRGITFAVAKGLPVVLDARPS